VVIDGSLHVQEIQQRPILEIHRLVDLVEETLELAKIENLVEGKVGEIGGDFRCCADERLFWWMKEDLML
jgi:hypothetical protein